MCSPSTDMCAKKIRLGLMGQALSADIIARTPIGPSGNCSSSLLSDLVTSQKGLTKDSEILHGLLIPENIRIPPPNLSSSLSFTMWSFTSQMGFSQDSEMLHRLLIPKNIRIWETPFPCTKVYLRRQMVDFEKVVTGFQNFAYMTSWEDV